MTIRAFAYRRKDETWKAYATDVDTKRQEAGEGCTALLATVRAMSKLEEWLDSKENPPIPPDLGRTLPHVRR